MFETLLLLTVLLVGVRALLSVRSHPSFSRKWVLASLLSVLLYALFAVGGLVLMLRGLPAILPESISSDMLALWVVGGFVVWVGAGTLILIRVMRPR